MNAPAAVPEIRKGLEGVIVDVTTVSKVMPEINSLTYRGYPVQDLAEKCSFLEVAYLLWNKELPTKSQLEKFEKEEKSKRALSPALIEVIKKFPKNAHPMDTVRTAVSFQGLEDERIWDNSDATNRDKAMNLLAKIPTMIAHDYRARKGLPIIAPDTSLGFNENFFNMCFGKVPPAEVIKAFDVSLTLYAEHGFNASTFASRVITSTTSDLYGAVTGGIAALKGPLHGGANEQVMHMLLEVKEPENAVKWMQQALKDKRKVMGFGHRVYKNGDSRVPTMKKYARGLGEWAGQPKWGKISDGLEEVMLKEKNIMPNLDFPAGPAYYLMGFDIDMFTPIFVMSRITGWTAHIFEQTASNRLIRPLSKYEGEKERKVKSLAER